MSFDAKDAAWFAGGFLFGTVGLRLLSTKEARKGFVQVTAVGLRAKDSVMKTVTVAHEELGDILADAKCLNETRITAAQAEAEMADSKIVGEE